MREEEKIPKPFEPHPYLSEEINRGIIESEIEGGAWLNKLEVNHALEMITANHRYVIEKKEDGYYISGHPKFCPKPTKVIIHGSTWGKGSRIKVGFVGRGLHLEFKLPGQDPFLIILTSPIKEVRELPDAKYEEFKKGIDG